MQYYASNGSGFKAAYRDTGSEGFPIGGCGAEQTHHFSFYLSLGINATANGFAAIGNAAVFTYGVARDNAGDQRLSRAAFKYGVGLGTGQLKLKNIGAWIRENICDKEDHGLYN